MTIPNSTEWRSVPIDSVKPYGRTLRRHDRRKIKKITALLEHYGQIAPIIVDADGVIIDGTSVWQAMRDMGASEIAVITIASRNPAEIKALRLALNRIAEDVAWDKPSLKAEIEELVSLSFDLELTAFEVAEIDAVLDVDVPTANVVDDGSDIPKTDAVPVSILGNIWTCGAHRLGCGSAHDAGFVAKVAENATADVAFVDPPYNVPIAGFVSGKGNIQHREFVAGVGELSSEEFTRFLGKALDVLKASCIRNALIYACMDWRHIAELLAAGKSSGLALYNLCVWTKTNAGMGALYRNQHELVAVFCGGKDAPANNVELGRHGRNRSNVWTYRGFNSFGAERDELLAAHPTVKPVALVADVLRDVTARGGVVLDTFLGSGTTLIAAEETGRRCFGTELDPLYVDVAVRRWQAKTKRDAVHADTGELFNERAERLTTATLNGGDRAIDGDAPDEQ